jgi:hypothetical protein
VSVGDAHAALDFSARDGAQGVLLLHRQLGQFLRLAARFEDRSVDAARLAVERGGDRVRGAVAASDAFFPFPDGLEVLTAAGVKAVVQPGGSVRDDEVIAAAAAA